MANLGRTVLSCLVALCLRGVVAAASDAPVEPGSAAPPLAIKKWFKGSPISALSPDKTYVVEFWATWCGPCIESIPHLTEIAKKNPDVTFIGVSIWEDEQDDVISKFVKDMGDKMDYNVGYSGNQDGMAATWMTPAGQNGIPTAFIVKKGVIEWVGHPMSIEKPLAEVKSGAFDRVAFKKKFDAQALKTRQMMALEKEQEDIEALFDSGKTTEAKSKLTDFVTKNPGYADSAERMRFKWLAKEDPNAWQMKAVEYANSKDQSQRRILLAFALMQTSKGGNLELGRNAIDLALKASEGKDSLETQQFARAFFTEVKDYPSALIAVKRVLELIPTSDQKSNATLKANMLKDKAELESKIQNR